MCGGLRTGDEDAVGAGELGVERELEQKGRRIPQIGERLGTVNNMWGATNSQKKTGRGSI